MEGFGNNTWTNFLRDLDPAEQANRDYDVVDDLSNGEEE